MSIADKLAAIAENEQKVYVAGFQAGSSQGGGDTEEAYNEGYAEGQKAAHDKFWDGLQTNGKRTKYNYAFYLWDINKGFYPKYDISPTEASFLFRDCAGDSVDLTERLNECGVKLDLSKATSADSCFYSSCITRVPEINLQSWSGGGVFFGYSRIQTVDKFTAHPNFSFGKIFTQANYLKNITFAGEICSDLNMSYSPLSTDSMKNIIQHLKVYDGTENDGVYKLTFSETCWQKLEKEPMPLGISWKEYVISKGWQV